MNQDVKVCNGIDLKLISKINLEGNMLFLTDARDQSLTGICMYFLRLTSKKYLGEETFQVRF